MKINEIEAALETSYLATVNLHKASDRLDAEHKKLSTHSYEAQASSRHHWLVSTESKYADGFMHFGISNGVIDGVSFRGPFSKVDAYIYLKELAEKLGNTYE